MSDLETAVRAAVTQLTRRYRVMPVEAADDEAVTAILAACRAQADAAVKADRAEVGRAVAARPKPPAKRVVSRRQP